MAAEGSRVMTGVVTGVVLARVEEFIALRRGLGYRSPSQERALRAFARHLDHEGHEGPIPLESSLDWATSTASIDPCNPARRLTMVRGFLRHLAAIDGATEVPDPGLLGSTGHRKPPHIYSEAEICDLLAAAAGLAPVGGLRPHCYVALFGLIACTGLRISEALALQCGDVDLDEAVLTVRAVNAAAPEWCRCTPVRCPHWPTTPPNENTAMVRRARTQRSSAPTAATRSATARRITRSAWCAGSWAGPRRGVPGRPASTICDTAWWFAASRPGTPKASTSMPTSRSWRPTSGTSKCVTSTGTSRPSRS